MFTISIAYIYINYAVACARLPTEYHVLLSDQWYDWRWWCSHETCPWYHCSGHKHINKWFLYFQHGHCICAPTPAAIADYCQISNLYSWSQDQCYLLFLTKPCLVLQDYVLLHQLRVDIFGNCARSISSQHYTLYTTWTMDWPYLAQVNYISLKIHFYHKVMDYDPSGK